MAKGRPKSWDERSFQDDRVEPRPEGGGVGMGALVGVLVLALLAGFAGGFGASYLTGGRAPPSGDGGGPQETPDVTYTLRALITGYVGVGGSIEGVRNPDLTAAKGDLVKLVLVNGDGLEHDLTVVEHDHTPHVTTQGTSVSVTFTAGDEGTYAYYCSLPGHRAAGMEGRFVVGAGGGGGGPGPAQQVDVSDISKDPTAIPPPITRTAPDTVPVHLEAREVVAEMEDGTTYTYWTYNRTVPGPFFRVRVNDTVVVHFRNAADSMMEHSVDFHAVTGQGGGAAATKAMPGEEKSFSFKAINPGIYVYHCASPDIPAHIASGMYGLILVEPEGGLPPVDREFYVMQGDMYTKWPAGTDGHQEFDDEALDAEEPTYVVFNGKFQALTGDNAMAAEVGDTVRIYFGVGGPNLVSSFHIIGEIFDRAYNLGDVGSPPLRSVQTILVPPGGAAIVEFTLEVPATYILVDHALARALHKGAVGFLVATGDPNDEIFDDSP